MLLMLLNNHVFDGLNANPSKTMNVISALINFLFVVLFRNVVSCVSMGAVFFIPCSCCCQCYSILSTP